MARLRDRWLSRAERFDRPGEVYLGAWQGARLLGAGGLSRDPYSDDRGLARLRHLYVLPEARGDGLGAVLVASILGHARAHFDRVRLRTDNPAAARLYERLGFSPSSLPDETHRLVF